MDKNDVYLKLILNYEGKKYEKTFIEFQSFEKIKDISRKEFNIDDAVIKNIQYKFINEPGKEPVIIKNDNDLMLLMKEINEYNYEINLELSHDKINMLKAKGELLKKFDNYLNKKIKEKKVKIKLIINYLKLVNININLKKKFLIEQLDYESKRKELEKLTNDCLNSNNPEQIKEILNNFKLKDEKSTKELLNEEKIKLNEKLKNFEKIENEIENELQNKFRSFEKEIIKLIMKKCNINSKEYEKKCADDLDEEFKYKPKRVKKFQD